MSEETTQADAGSQGAAEAAPVTFIDSLPEDLRSEPSLKNFTDSASLAKSYVHAQRLIGADKIAIPKGGSTPEEWRSVYTKLGAPETPEAYQFKNKDFFEPEALTVFQKQAYDAGLTGRQADQMVEYLANASQESENEYNTGAQAARNEGLQALETEWGAAFDQKMTRARSAAFSELPTEVREVLDDNGKTVKQEVIPLFEDTLLADGRVLGDMPEIIMMFEKLADSMSEDTLVGEQTSLIKTPDQAFREREEIVKDTQGPYWDQYHPEHKAYVARALELQELINP
tara:strand:- start:13695 stop:14552 length:858 start_codon:yes stop_codon:yes gene_type:complete